MLKYANRFNIKVIGMASKPDSVLLKASDIKILIPNVKKKLIQQEWFLHQAQVLLYYYNDSLAIALMNKIKFSKNDLKYFIQVGILVKHYY